MIKKKLVALTMAALVIPVAGCSTIAAADEIGLYYMQGNSDGDQFGFCIEPGKTGDAEWNNQVYYLPTSLRTWNVGGEGSDSGSPIISSSEPQEGQPSGVEVQVWPKVTFYLNTFCDNNGGVVKQFWETIGRRYGANTSDGWRKMLLEILVPPLEKVIRDITKDYKADPLVGNVGGVVADMQTRVAERFAVELKRTSGGDFFCGPTFQRGRPECPQVEVLIKDVTYNDPGIQAARNEKQKAVELAAAQLARAQGEAAALQAEAEGKANAARELQALYSNPAWVALQAELIRLEQMKFCGQNPNCQMIVGMNGDVLITTK